jgi:hypothetical protein
MPMPMSDTVTADVSMPTHAIKSDVYYSASGVGTSVIDCTSVIDSASVIDSVGKPIINSIYTYIHI